MSPELVSVSSRVGRMAVVKRSTMVLCLSSSVDRFRLRLIKLRVAFRFVDRKSGENICFSFSLNVGKESRILCSTSCLRSLLSC